MIQDKASCGCFVDVVYKAGGVILILVLAVINSNEEVLQNPRLTTERMWILTLMDDGGCENKIN